MWCRHCQYFLSQRGFPNPRQETPSLASYFRHPLLADEWGGATLSLGYFRVQFPPFPDFIVFNLKFEASHGNLEFACACQLVELLG